jgi:hypothetical protein
MVEADALAADLLATDADRAREARDWRTTTAGGPPAVVARNATPQHWTCHVRFNLDVARHIAAAAADAGMTHAQYVHEAVVADLHRRTGIDPALLRRGTPGFQPKSETYRAKALLP